MNTKNLKSYAPKARKQFIEAVKKRAAHYGIYDDRIAEVRIEGGAAIIEGRAFTRKEGEQRKRLESKLAERASATYQEKYDMFTREIAYTWFNRLAALRYMEIHDYFDHGFRVLSHPTNQGSLPEILNHASEVADGLNLDKDHIIELQLAGDKEEELYRELLLGQCHQLAKIMPQIFKGLAFETIDDATELLLPNNLTKTDSILKGLINDIPEEDWQDIEVIGWLYQFYISEHKDSVMGKVVKSEDIPAATQLFTPNWIVKYLVQNSVGRQWLATYPDSDLKDKMEYYIEPAEQSEEVIEQLKAITPTSIDPEEIKVLDPACGSGHILVEVYEVLREIYLERGYRLREIPELILTKNIYGLDIDDRAAQLAGFALMMKAREDDRRIFQRVEEGDVTLNVYSLQSSEHLDIHKLWNALDLEEKHLSGTTAGLFDEVVQPSDFAYNELSKKTIPAQAGIYADYYQLLQLLKTAFLQAKTFGSLIHIDNQHLQKLIALKELLRAKERGSDPTAKQAALEVLPVVNQSILIAQQYDSVVANPPYMGNKGMNPELKSFVEKNYKEAKYDLYACFIEQSVQLTKHGHFSGLITIPNWMFLSSFESFRRSLVEDKIISSLIHNGRGVWGSDFGSVSFVIQNMSCDNYKAKYFKLFEEQGDVNSNQELIETFRGSEPYSVTLAQLSKISGFPLSYWALPEVIQLFSRSSLAETFESGGRCKTTNDEVYMRRLWEVSNHSIGVEGAWVLTAKGGAFRRYFGNVDTVIKWDKPAKDFYRSVGGITNSRFWEKPGITWSIVSAKGGAAFRYKDSGVQYNSVAPTIFLKEDEKEFYKTLVFLNSNIVNEFVGALSPTFAVNVGEVLKIPYIDSLDDEVEDLGKKLVTAFRSDWDSQEVSIDYKRNLLVSKKQTSIKASFEKLCTSRQQHEKEVNNCQIKIDNLIENSLGITLSSNIAELRNNLIFNTSYASDIPDLLSYHVGCMMGRYSLDRDGLVYAHSANEGFKELVSEEAYRTFPADDDGIIPLASEEWLFDDDASTRFKEFVKTVWGDENLSENLEFVAESLCLHALKPKKGESVMETVRRYFSTQFFKDHCKTYKKRPIYWLFSSGKEKAFECLVYLHRYNEGTLSRMRTEYVTPLMGKYEAQHTLLSEQQLQATGTESRGIEKDLKSLEKKQAELRTFDEQLKHYAEKRITLDLDDGVKANYGKFGNLLADVKAIHGKAVK
ncbi:BREX-1 system adenine-specific DNA-methyltransferase PglX [Pseudoalteromonas sp. NZS11]|uniref:BREX-1 system adenine-specific DNA-methyltransferase PglX n=1 Tax=Pseudoalteromonas sp. NZS11 TaxID=2792049 RepID=UPI0018CCB127|nr:BREX-1 system adenine-specific DNA-methyltransferase PglX [Pseudoalteromonas sp. NZS11]MBH0080179.1 BREX-1 system adenine-specific DNA-methyltransferase PglX [Pseudoalteromonas sp. NZS11]